LRSKWPMPNDRHWCTLFAIDVADAWWSTQTHVLYDRFSQCPMINTDARSLRSKWPIPDDRQRHTCYTIEVADAWWSTETHVLYDRCDRCLMMNTDADAWQSMWHNTQHNNFSQHKTW
jgi:hypothetical protein